MQKVSINDESIEKAKKLFDEILQDKYIEDDEELKGIQEFNDLARREPEPDKKEADDLLQKALQAASEWKEKLDKGEFKISENIEHSDYGPNSEVLSQINEESYSISYRSNFGDISTGKERVVDSQASEREFDSQGYRIERTISAAILKSMPGDTILVKGGQYNESLIIDRSVQIKAFDDHSKVYIVASKEDAISLETNSARLVGLTISCSTPGDTYCLRVRVGFLELENCEIKSSCSGCVRLEGNARIYAKGCQLSMNMFTSTSLMPNSKAIFDTCDFEKPTGETNDKFSIGCIPAITIDQNATCIVVNSHHIKSTILFKPHSRGMIKDCTISSSTTGITVQDSATPLVIKCKIKNCKHGISMEGRSMGVFLNNLIDNNEVGLNAVGAQNFLMRNNKIRKSKQIGARLAKGAFCTFEGGEIVGSEHNGIQVQSGSKLTMKNVEVHKNQKSGIYCGDSSEKTAQGGYVKLIECTVQNNKEHGVFVHSGFDFSMEGGIVTKNSSSGICGPNAQISLDNTLCLENNSKEVIIFGNSVLTAIGCTFTDRQVNKDLTNEEKQSASVFVKDNARGVLEKCKWIGFSAMRSLQISGDAAVNVNGCIFQETYIGIYTSDRATCDINKKTKFLASIKDSKAVRAVYMNGGTINLIDSSVKTAKFGIEVNKATINIKNCQFESLYNYAFKFDEARCTILESEFHGAGYFNANIQSIGSNIQIIDTNFYGKPQAATSYNFNNEIPPNRVCIHVLPKIDPVQKKPVAISDIKIQKCRFADFSENAIKAQMGAKIQVTDTIFDRCGVRESVLVDTQSYIKLSNITFCLSIKIQRLRLLE